MKIDEIVGQTHLLSPDAPFYKLLIKQALPHSFFYGPPGTGKTSLAKAVAKIYKRDFYELNATSLKIEEIRKIVTNYKNALFKPIIFIDEVHRLSRTQQEVLLPIMEKNQALIIGASSENPFFYLTAAIRSRSMLWEFKPLSDEDLLKILEKLDVKIEKEAKEYLLRISGGDARNLKKFVSLAKEIETPVSLKTLKALLDGAYYEGVNSKESHYELISAFVKSMRGSDIDAALYYLARLIEGGESPEFIGRRMVIFASEDIGNANPNALNLAVSTLVAVKSIGYPESSIILSQCAIYLTSSPKSDAAYRAIKSAKEAVKSGKIYPVPKHLKPPNFESYLNPHDFGGYVDQKYKIGNMKFYSSKKIGFERRLDEWIMKIKNQDNEEA
jgi:putative ATPase